MSNIETSPLYLPLFNAFVAAAPVATPAFYWDVYSNEERIKKICEHIASIEKYADTLGIKINHNTEEIEKLWEEVNKIKTGTYDEKIKEVISRWVSEHMEEIISQAIKMVFFGLTDDGYFCAYIPDSWKEIQFSTPMIYDRSDYGCLVLSY